MKIFAIQTPPFALVPSCSATGLAGATAATPLSARLRVDAARWAATAVTAAKAAANKHMNVTGSPPRGAPV